MTWTTPDGAARWAASAARARRSRPSSAAAPGEHAAVDRGDARRRWSPRWAGPAARGWCGPPGGARSAPARRPARRRRVGVEASTGMPVTRPSSTRSPVPATSSPTTGRPEGDGLHDPDRVRLVGRQRGHHAGGAELARHRRAVGRAAGAGSRRRRRRRAARRARAARSRSSPLPRMSRSAPGHPRDGSAAAPRSRGGGPCSARAGRWRRSGPAAGTVPSAHRRQGAAVADDGEAGRVDAGGLARSGGARSG